MEQVDSADTFPTVLTRFDKWLERHRLTGRNRIKSCLVTDGPWDMGRFLYGQCKISEVQYPPFCKRWVNIRKTFSALYKSKRQCLGDMLQQLGMDFEGRPHCGMDDARNIARILIRLAADGGRLLPNERIALNSNPGSDGKRERHVYSIMYDSTGNELRKKPFPQQHRHKHHNDLASQLERLAVS
ncbi:hypothetical protein B566_EDAN010408 [Ephemera danica]|nr:hypothetical protein B566_EDAN010408 [Ephemera danica]